MFHYKGYTGRYVNDRYLGMVHGQVHGLRSSVTFQGMSVAAARKEFQAAVERYLDRCREVGMEPEVQREPAATFVPTPRTRVRADFSEN